jgi:DNA-binding transcriptional MerR regulator/methylmalonyl-CoA mutase cobalamin-binding subunit
MYTIKQAAARTGLTIPTIRAWERRYGVISPERTESGYRLYDETAIERLAAMRTLVEQEGWRPGQAAERIRTPGVDLATLASASAPIAETLAERRSGLPAASADQVVPRFIAAAQQVDVDEMERILDEAFAAQRFELAMDGVVFPALRAVGRAWADGELDVAAEHAASETVRRRLARFFDAARGPMMPTRLLVGMPPGGHHELGVFAFAVACRRAGQSVAYLGMNVPLESWMRVVRETAVRAVVLGAVTAEDAVAVDRVAAAIAMLDHPPVCFAGGPASLDVTGTSGAVRLPLSLDAAVAVVAETTTPVRRRTAR